MSTQRAVPTVTIDNDRVRVTEWRFAPGAATGPHRHEYAYVVVPMTTGTLASTGPAGAATAALVTGEPYFRAGRRRARRRQRQPLRVRLRRDRAEERLSGAAPVAVASGAGRAARGGVRARQPLRRRRRDGGAITIAPVSAAGSSGPRVTRRRARPAPHAAPGAGHPERWGAGPRGSISCHSRSATAGRQRLGAHVRIDAAAARGASGVRRPPTSIARCGTPRADRPPARAGPLLRAGPLPAGEAAARRGLVRLQARLGDTLGLGQRVTDRGYSTREQIAEALGGSASASRRRVS